MSNNITIIKRKKICERLRNTIVDVKTEPNKNIKFILFDKHCRQLYVKPKDNMKEYKCEENKDIKSVIFEYFAMKYFKSIYNWSYDRSKYFGFKNVWLIQHYIPEDIISYLQLNGINNISDIDIICKNDYNQYYAINIKHKRKYKRGKYIKPEELTNFYLIVNQSGPWIKYITFTNVDFVKRNFDDMKCQDICRRHIEKINSI